MAEIKLSFDITFSRRFITAFGAAAMMLCAVPELDSESVTLSTYYPAPSGVYTDMITTRNSYFARDGGSVRIGPPSSGVAQLYVRDDDNASTSDIAQFFANDLAQGIGIGYNTIEAVGSNPDQDILLLPKGTGNVGIGATASGQKLNVVGAAQASNFVTDGPLQTRQGSACFDDSHTYPAALPGQPGGGNAPNLCPGRYITMIDGIYSQRYILTVVPGAAEGGYKIDFRCCPCPPGGCGGM